MWKMKLKGNGAERSVMERELMSFEGIYTLRHMSVLTQTYTLHIKGLLIIIFFSKIIFSHILTLEIYLLTFCFLKLSFRLI